MPERPISDYAVIGDTRTAALSSSDGSIDWLCLPRFDSEPIFGRLLSTERGGSFSITAEDVRTTERRYREGSAVLETTWQTRSGVLELTEGMVLDASSTLSPQCLLVRRLRCIDGTAHAKVRFDPRAGLRGKPPLVSARGSALVCTWGSLAVSLESFPSLQVSPGVDEAVTLQAGEEFTSALGVADRAPLVFVEPRAAYERLEETDRWWRQWSAELHGPLQRCGPAQPHHAAPSDLLTFRRPCCGGDHVAA